MAIEICNHFKYGFCKYRNKNECNKQHIEEVCKNRTTCKTKDCNLRHPRACKRYALERFCRYGDNCAYFHVTEHTNEMKAEIQAAIKPYENKIERLEHEIENIKRQLNSFCSLTQEAHEKVEDIEDQVTQQAEIMYTLKENFEETKNDTKCKHRDKRETDECSLKNSIIEIKSDMEDLRTLNNETHCRIRNIEEQLEAMHAEESENSTDEDENDEQIAEENRARMLIIQNNSKYHGLKTNENEKNSEVIQKKTNNNI